MVLWITQEMAFRKFTLKKFILIGVYIEGYLILRQVPKFPFKSIENEKIGSWFTLKNTSYFNHTKEIATEGFSRLWFIHALSHVHGTLV